MTIIERVARTIVEARTPGLNLTADYLENFGYMNEARAAIAAIREPTDEMIAAIMLTAWGSLNNREEIVRDWRKMIDAALDEKCAPPNA